MRSSVISDFGPARTTSMRIVRMLISSTLCRNGSARQPPDSTIFWPPKPVRMIATSREVLR
jgi:hypothetical protein